MPLQTVPKASSQNSNTPSRVISRQEVSVSRPTASSARAEALKARLMNQVPNNPVAPRPARSSARAEEMAKLQKFPTPQAPTHQTPPPKNDSRVPAKDLTAIEPPPSGLVAPQAAPSIESPQAAPAEANSEPLSSQFVALARKERQLRKAQQEFKAAQDAWKQEQANYIPKERLTSETLKVLTEAGISADKLVELQINQAASQDPNQVLLNKVAELEKQLKGLTDPETGTLAQRDKAAYDSAVAQIRQDIKLLVESNPAYGTINSEGQTEEVVTLITRVFEDEGVVLDVEEAAKLIEDKLVQRLSAQYEKLSKYEKIMKARKPAETAEATPAQQPPQSNTTLTNAGASTRQLTPRERAILRVQEAIDRTKGK
jgi:hypothetical protein